jgi:hypothetical protein
MSAGFAGRRRWQIGALVVGTVVSLATLTGTTGAATTTTTIASTTTTLGCIEGPTIGYSGTSPVRVGSSLSLTGARLNTDASGEAPCWGGFSGPVHLTLVVGATTVVLGDVTASNGIFTTTISIPAGTPDGSGAINAAWDDGGLAESPVSVGITLVGAVVPTIPVPPAPAPAQPNFTG